jgi:hypothetical protein
MNTRLLKKCKQNNSAHNKRSLLQGPSMFNNQKEHKRLEETSPVLVVREKNTNTAMADENYY